MIVITNLEKNELQISLGKLFDIEVRTTLDLREESMIENVNLEDLDQDTKHRIKELSRHFKEASANLDWFVEILKDHYDLPRNKFYDLLAIKESIFYNRSIPNSDFLPFILGILNRKQINEICKNFQLKGFSSMSKQETIDFIAQSLSEQEIRSFLISEEERILKGEIEAAIRILSKKSSERLANVKVINKERNEMELTFIRRIKNNEIKTESYISINLENMNNPDRDCDCHKGISMGLCEHFWVRFLILALKNRFDLSSWNFSILPDTLLTFIQNHQKRAGEPRQ